MFIEIPADKIRKGLIGMRRFFDEYVPTVSFEVKCVGYMVDDQMVGIVVYGNGRIYTLAVAEDHRGCGYGRRLFEYVAAETPNRQVVSYIPMAYHKSVAAFVSWGFFFEGFFSNMESKTRCYRLNYNPNRVEDVDFYDGKFWEDTATMAEEAVVMFNAGTLY